MIDEELAELQKMAERLREEMSVPIYQFLNDGLGKLSRQTAAEVMMAAIGSTTATTLLSIHHWSQRDLSIATIWDRYEQATLTSIEDMVMAEDQDGE